MIVLSGVAVRRVVAAADVAARHTQPQMYPTAADLQAIFTPVGARCYLDDLTDVFAIFHSVINGVAKSYACRRDFSKATGGHEAYFQFFSFLNLFTTISRRILGR